MSTQTVSSVRFMHLWLWIELPDKHHLLILSHPYKIGQWRDPAWLLVNMHRRKGNLSLNEMSRSCYMGPPWQSTSSLLTQVQVIKTPNMYQGPAINYRLGRTC